MVQAQSKKLTFEEYLNYSDKTNNRYELIDGELMLCHQNLNLIISLLTIYFSILLAAG
jgi:hypothetical protein